MRAVWQQEDVEVLPKPTAGLKPLVVAAFGQIMRVVSHGELRCSLRTIPLELVEPAADEIDHERCAVGRVGVVGGDHDVVLGLSNGKTVVMSRRRWIHLALR